MVTRVYSRVNRVFEIFEIIDVFISVYHLGVSSEGERGAIL